MTAEQLEEARAERLRQNGHGAITIEDVRTWIEETGLCIFLPRSAQAGFTAPTFVEAVAGQRTTEPTLELIGTAEALLVRLESEGVAVRLNLSGQPGDQPDYVVAGWVLPYIYALRGDRDWRRSPQLTGSRQVSQLAVQAAKQIDTGNMNAMQIRDLLGREVTETAVLRALHELWKQLRIIPVVPEVGTPALWQPLRQRFQKAIAEGASTSQVTAISVLASIYLQAVIAASMEDVELFLSPLTSRSKIREVVRGLAATRQVHSTQLGHSPMFYVAGTLPEFPAVPNFQISTSYSYRTANYRGSNYLGTDPDQSHEDDYSESLPAVAAQSISVSVETRVVEAKSESVSDSFSEQALPVLKSFLSDDDDSEPTTAKPSHFHESRPAVLTTNTGAGAGKPLVARPRTARPAAAPRPSSARPASTRSGSARSASSAHPRDSRDSSDRRRAPAPRGSSSNGSSSRTPIAARGNGSRPNGGGAHSPNSNASNGHGSNGHSANGHSASGSHAQKGATAKPPARNGWTAKPASNGNGHGKGSTGVKSPTGSGSHARPAGRSAVAATPRAAANGKPSFKPGTAAGSRGAKPAPTANGGRSGNARPAQRPGSGLASGPASRTSSHAVASKRTDEHEPSKASAGKRYSFSGQAKQAPKPVAKRAAATASRTKSRPVAKTAGKPAGKSGASSGAKSRTADAKRHR